MDPTQRFTGLGLEGFGGGLFGFRIRALVMLVRCKNLSVYLSIDLSIVYVYVYVHAHVYVCVYVYVYIYIYYTHTDIHVQYARTSYVCIYI